MSQKKVRADKSRDFTIRGRPAEGVGVLTIRIRTYLAGRAIYAVIVVSAPNRELPLDCGRFSGSLAIGETRARAAGTPEPEPTGRELAGWGTMIDPDKDCQFLPEGTSLTIKTPGTFHAINPDGGQLNSPRIVRSIEGDFTIKVKVTGDFKPGGQSTNPKTVPFNGPGFLSGVIPITSSASNGLRSSVAARCAPISILRNEREATPAPRIMRCIQGERVTSPCRARGVEFWA